MISRDGLTGQSNRLVSIQHKTQTVSPLPLLILAKAKSHSQIGNYSDVTSYPKKTKPRSPSFNLHFRTPIFFCRIGRVSDQTTALARANMVMNWLPGGYRRQSSHNSRIPLAALGYMWFIQNNAPKGNRWVSPSQNGALHNSEECGCIV